MEGGEEFDDRRGRWCFLKPIAVGHIAFHRHVQRVEGEVAVRLRAVIAVAVVVHAGGGVPVLARQAQVQREEITPGSL